MDTFESRQEPLTNQQNTNDTEARRAAILDIAMDLFAQNGYASTSMSAIARAVGIDQSTMYYWFKSKEHLLDEIVKLHAATVHEAETLRAADGSFAARLYALVYHDVLNLCKLPVDFYELETAAAKDRTRFHGFFDNYHTIALIVSDLVEMGVEAGEFTQDDAWTCTFNIMVCDEGLQHRYHQGKHGARLFNDGTFTRHIDCSAESYARLGAFNALSCLMGAGPAIEAAHQEALDKGWLDK